ncbi:hypothetical protein LCGC14_2173000 [marine sediment metagenome]|uniref:Acetyltransferase n=1 Tax=marine sediment metagenome TaxID=412755 RepID=A0A0F9G258_9ZZZZ
MRFKKWKRPKFKKVTGDLYKTKYNWFVTCPENLELGKNTDIGIFTYINARYGVKIGENVQIGSHCSIFSHNTINDIANKVEINRDAKIGSHSILLPGIIIDTRELIKAFSVVYVKDGKRTIKSGSVVY